MVFLVFGLWHTDAMNQGRHKQKDAHLLDRARSFVHGRLNIQPERGIGIKWAITQFDDLSSIVDTTKELYVA